MVDTKAKQNAIIELIHWWDEAAYLRAVCTNNTTNIYPDSSLSMNVVFGLEICKIKNIRINEPIA
jgi:hypothetical protein